MIKNTDFIKSRLLLASVFVTGAAVLIIEIVATRILSPYYGNTIYTTSSVIGTVLAALSLGYYLGGILSDKFPYYKFFYGIIFTSGLLIVLIQSLGIILLPPLSMLLSISSGPFVSSLIFFFVPAFLLGTLSPFAIKLNQIGPDNIGKQSGEVFFWSTLGSIAGSFLSGFLLIPHFGINFIIISTGIFVGLWGFLGLLLFTALNKKIIITLLALVLISGFFLAPLFWPKKDSNILYEKDGVYEKITISEGEWEGKPARFLFQDKSYSAAMYVGSDELVYNYTKYYKLYKLFNEKAKRAFLVGGGAYSIPKALLNDSSDMKVDVAEIEPELFSLAKQYFNLKDSDRINNYIEDGRRFLAKTNNTYDVIISDVYYSLFSIPLHFTTKEFFNLAKSKLSDNGIFVGNFVGTLDKESPSLIFSEIRTFKSVFPNSYFFAVNSPKTESSQNIIFVGINGLKNIDFESPEILQSKDPIINNLALKNISFDNVELLKYKEITDDFAPIEYLVSKVINKWQ